MKSDPLWLHWFPVIQSWYIHRTRKKEYAATCRRPSDITNHINVWSGPLLFGPLIMTNCMASVRVRNNPAINFCGVWMKRWDDGRWAVRYYQMASRKLVRMINNCNRDVICRWIASMCYCHGFSFCMLGFSYVEQWTKLSTYASIYYKYIPDGHLYGANLYTKKIILTPLQSTFWVSYFGDRETIGCLFMKKVI